ncbi:MAG: hypothetical protein K2L80_00325 [Muribaculaceae bacterium]|nr:hypothetical protein [Muribaculaceae bacterium]MDE6331025.1 hypothetical protein [Muribaculaceae bacterium]
MNQKFKTAGAAAFMAAVLMAGGMKAQAGGNVSNSDSSAVRTDFRQYLPKIGAALRTRYELDTENASSRFQVRNARVRLSGQVGPKIEYFMQADFCDQGKFQMLDAYAAFLPDTHWRLIAGQTRVPFSPDASRAPGNYFFANRSFIGRYMGNQRSVGVKACYNAGALPLYVEGGVFNSAPIGNHEIWNGHFTYGITGSYTIGGVITPEIGFKSDVPKGGIRTNLLSAALTLRSGHWFAEGEYVLQTYSRNRFKRCHGFNVQAQYATAVNAGIFNHWSAELRYDGMSDHSGALPGDDGLIVCDYIRRQRVTAGTTLSYYRGSAHVDLRLNYEQYFYPSAYTVPEGAGNKLVAEIILYF